MRAVRTFRSLLESASDALVIVNEQLRIVLVNKQTELLFSYTREELLDRRVEVLNPSHARMQWVCHMEEN
ncbi:MAG TPA: PAS domain S-box protein [Candidatus Binatia bacterium]|nr:PAS domain S-box protein [Candidatus Binatia bacterium]